MDNQIDTYIRDTARWGREMQAVRDLLLESGLEEALKWRKPCFLHNGNNIAILQPMKNFLALLFFKGVLLDDPEGLLEAQGPNSRSSKRVVFRSPADVSEHAAAVQGLARSAMAVEAAGLKVGPPAELDLPEELTEALAADSELSEAFDALTPGRQRGYAIHISGAKQAATRRDRIGKCRSKILAGKGFQER